MSKKLPDQISADQSTKDSASQYKIFVSIETPICNNIAYNKLDRDSDESKKVLKLNQLLILRRAEAVKDRFDKVIAVPMERTDTIVEDLSNAVSRAIEEAKAKNVKIVFLGEGIFLDGITKEACLSYSQASGIPSEILSEGMFSKYSQNELSQACQNILIRTKPENLAITLKCCESLSIDKKREDVIALKYRDQIAQSATTKEYTSIEANIAEIPTDETIRVSLTEKICRDLYRCKTSLGIETAIAVKGYPTKFMTRPDNGRILSHKQGSLSERDSIKFDQGLTNFIDFIRRSEAHPGSSPTQREEETKKFTAITIENFGGIVSKGTFKC